MGKGWLPRKKRQIFLKIGRKKRIRKNHSFLIENDLFLRYNTTETEREVQAYEMGQGKNLELV